MKRKIIITIHSDKMTDAEAMDRVFQVIDRGKILKFKETPQYCFFTIFADGTKVSVRDKKRI